MNTEAFTEAARAEANARYGTAGNREVWMDAAEWARAHLAAQEPTDAEVEAVARVIFMAGPSTDGTIAAWDGYPEHVKTRCLEKAREALSAAQPPDETRRSDERRQLH